MKQKTQITVGGLSTIFLFPGVSYAHSPSGYLAATFSIIVVSAVFSAIAKKLSLKFIFHSGDQLKLTSYILLALSEIAIMVICISSAIRLDNSGHSLIILAIASVIYFVISLSIHYFIFKNSPKALIKSMQATAIFPIFIWACSFTLFVPLYVLFGG